MKQKVKFHAKNIHKNGYDFVRLVKEKPLLSPFVFKNRFGNLTIDFSNPKAVKALNTALLKVYYDIAYWNFPDDNLCPPIPSRVDYIHHIADLIKDIKQVSVLDIGTGSTCIYPLLGVATYGWSFVGTDIVAESLDNAQQIIKKNNLTSKITLRHQDDKQHVLMGIIKEDDVFSAVMCNPPFYKSVEEAKAENDKKNKNLGSSLSRNFSGISNELWYAGGEKAFLHNYLYQSTLCKGKSKWFTSLVSKKENASSMEASSKKLGVSTFKIIPMHHGNKITRLVCWQF